MAKINRFEDLEIWQKAREMCKMIFEVTFREPFARDFALLRQIRSSSASVMDNIAEGFDRGGNKEFIQFLSIAKGSSAEVRSQIYRALDQNYISKEEFENIYKILDNVSGGHHEFNDVFKKRRTQRLKI